MKAELATRAKALGFDLCRVSRCGTPPHAEAFAHWLADGRAATMSWLERGKERRLDPQQVLPGARSVIVLAMNYFQGDERRVASDERKIASGARHEATLDTRHPALAPRAGRIARYAWGDDYHDIIEPKLHELDQWLLERGGRQKCYVDTGPVLERDFAALAGIGWHGKSTMLLNTEFGTWFFLSVILTTLDFDPDAATRDHCGKCTRCIDACPTDAITAPYQLDSRRCISYLTIENKGPIPEEFRPLIGDRIYGCDACLDACPWNRFAQISRETTFSARPAIHLALRDLLALDDNQFRAAFRKSPIKRIKRRGLLRNVCVALGNVGDVNDLPALQHAANDPEPLIAEHAQWAVEQIRSRCATTGRKNNTEG